MELAYRHISHPTYGVNFNVNFNPITPEESMDGAAGI
jgi:hypothetical protein